jgi:hypothetical protein
MPTISELSEQYARRIRQNILSPGIAQEIANQINGLTYTTNGAPISADDKEKILTEIENGRVARVTHSNNKFSVCHGTPGRV